MGGSFSFGQEMPQLSQCQVPELREAWHWQMPYAFAQEQLVMGDFWLDGSTLGLPPAAQVHSQK